MMLDLLLFSLLTGQPLATMPSTPLVAAKKAKRRKPRKTSKKQPRGAALKKAKSAPEPASTKPQGKPPAKAAAAAARPAKDGALNDGRPSLAAFALASDKGLSDSVADLLEEVMLTTLRSSGRFQSILGGSDLSAMLSLDQQRTALGCESADCATAFQEALGVPFLAVPKVGRVGDRFLVNLKIMNTSEGRVLARIHRMVQAETSLPSALESVTKQAIAMMFGEAVQLEELEDPAVVEARRRKRILRNTGLVFSLGGIGLVSYSYAAMADARSLLPPPGHRTTQQDVSNFASASASADLTWGLGAVVTAAGITAFALGW